jgi:alkylhydroperoxidase/carboxymuconolactone decarboxylase family protein YurZ
MRANGSWNPNWNELAELDPAWTEKFVDMALTPWVSGVLEPKVVEFLAIAVDAACTHMYSPGVRRHIRAALALGATKAEIMAVLQGVAVLGMHSCAMGVPILVEEAAALEASRAKGRATTVA